MAIYSAFYNGNIIELGDKGLVLLKSGFNWWAFLLSPIWALWHRLWWALLVYVGVSILVKVTPTFLQLPELFWVITSLMFSVFFASYAEMFRARKLTKLGYQELYPVQADNLEQAEELVLEQLKRRLDPVRGSTVGL